MSRQGHQLAAGGGPGGRMYGSAHTYFFSRWQYGQLLLLQHHLAVDTQLGSHMLMTVCVHGSTDGEWASQYIQVMKEVPSLVYFLCQVQSLWVRRLITTCM